MSDNEDDEIQERMSSVVQRSQKLDVNLLSLRIHWLETNMLAHLEEGQRLEYERGFLALVENLLDQMEPEVKQPKLAVVSQMPGQQGFDLGA